MANKELFQSAPRGEFTPEADTKNAAGGKAYERTPESALAQYALTGCLGNTYYTSAKDQLDKTIQLANAVSPEFLAKTAIYAREKGFMKDMPALLMAILTKRDPVLVAKAFSRAIDNGKMIRNFVQIMRSGVAGRKSLGTGPKNQIIKWLLSANENQLLAGSVGNDPSLADVVKMVHPKPPEDWQQAFFGWLIGKDYKPEDLPPITKAFEAFKKDLTGEQPAVPFQMLTALQLKDEHWTQIARTANWHTTRMNLNTFQRHNVFKEEAMQQLVAERLKDPKAIKKAKVFPYQLMMAYFATRASDSGIPFIVSEALQDAMDIAIENVPVLPGRTAVLADVSGSMSSPVTGDRGSATSAVKCIDVAGLISASVLHLNPQARILAFDTRVIDMNKELNSRDTVMTNATKLASIRGGATACSHPIIAMTQLKDSYDNIIMVSDNESWADAYNRGNGSPLMVAWNTYRHQVNPKAKLVLIDLTPHANTQAVERPDILNIGGFSDNVFTLLEQFFKGEMSGGHWVDVINKVEL